ncbi:MAG: sigma-54 dependent transcriptional regulator [Desulforhabdus sp.]|jgi:DNA-binding NtrC family response regulator|nr:sigma-54 dependent transcriptional regulator [Desulforhabdus sp.]
MRNILIINEDSSWREFLLKALSPPYKVSFWPDSGGYSISNLVRQNKYDAVFLSAQLQLEDGFKLLRWFKNGAEYLPVIVTSEVEKSELIVKAVKEGAFDFLSRPFSAEKINLTIERALENRGLKNEIDYLRRKQDIVYDFDQIISVSPSMQQVVKTVKKFASTDSTILITGETGTGKSFLSGAIHFNSARRKKPFININCANIHETLLESELFGHEKGSFTGASKTRIGRLEQGNGGTVFLDEIGEMSIPLQSKFLRVLESKRFERLGGNQTIYSDVRIIAATNKMLEEEVTVGRFREDLYYRINVLRVHLPPLRERKECIEHLAQALLEKTCSSLHKKIEGFSPEVLSLLKSYSWPGNIRQLANTIERAAILEDRSVITKENVLLSELGRPAKAAPQLHIKSLESNEKEAILSALEECAWVQKEAAERLGVSPRALNYKIRKIGITHPRWLKNR